MHPVLSKYLDAKAIVAALKRNPQSEDEQALHKIADVYPLARQAILSKPPGSASQENQSSVIQLATFTALEVLSKHEKFADGVARAKKALSGMGLDEAQSRETLGALLIEEAFSEDADDEVFHAESVVESIETIINMCPFDKGSLEALFESFVTSREKDMRVAATHVAELLRTTTWADGEIALVTTDDISAVCEHAAVLGDQDAVVFFSELRSLLTFLAERKWLGSIRLKVLAAKIAEVEKEVSGVGDESDDDP